MATVIGFFPPRSLKAFTSYVCKMLASRRLPFYFIAVILLSYVWFTYRQLPILPTSPSAQVNLHDSGDTIHDSGRWDAFFNVLENNARPGEIVLERQGSYPPDL